MTGRTSFRLGIDFGTSHSVAVLQWPDGRVKPLVFDGSPLLPSCVFADPAGDLLVGRDAQHSARRAPERFEPHPKRRVDDGTVLLGDRELPVVELVAAVLARIAGEAVRIAGAPPAEVTVTCPATWAGARRAVLTEAAAHAGLGPVRLVAEPVAAAHYFTTVLGRLLAPGAALLVYDLGAGTFDATVVRHTAAGLEPVAVAGLADLGGLDLDAAVVDHLAAHTAGSSHDELWRRLRTPESTADRRDSRLLWDDARGAKELLSRASSTTVHVPLFDVDVLVTREDLERLARPLLERTMVVTRDVVQRSGLTADALAGVLLVGGSSRIPLVATLLHQTLGVPPTTIEQPELVVAEGSITADPAPAPEAVSPPPSEFVVPDVPPAAGGAPPGERRVPRVWLAVVVAVAAVFLLVSAVAGGLLLDRAADQATQRAAASGGSPPAYAADAQKAAREHLPALFSYDYRTFDQYVAGAVGRTTGKFRQDYQDTIEGQRDLVKRQRAVVQTKLVSLGVAAAEPDRVVLLAYLNQVHRNDNISGERLDQVRVKVTLVPVDGRWLVEQVAAL